MNVLELLPCITWPEFFLGSCLAVAVLGLAAFLDVAKLLSKAVVHIALQGSLAV